MVPMPFGTAWALPLWLEDALHRRLATALLVWATDHAAASAGHASNSPLAAHGARSPTVATT